MGKYLDSIGLANLIGKIKTTLGLKQDTLVSGTNIKTVNNQSLLGSGNITISGGSSLPSGGSINDVLVKNSGAEGDLAWRSPDDVVLDAFTVFSEDLQDEGVPYFMWDSPNSVHIEFRDYLPLTGGTVNGSMTVTGNITADSTIYAQDSHMYIKRASLDTTAANNGISADSYLYHGWLDKNSRFSGWCGNVAYPDGRIATQLAARRVNGTANLDNILILAVNPNGERTVTVSDAAPWRAALGLGTAATHDHGDYAPAQHSHPEYFSSTVNRTANTVLAAPNGSNGRASFRKLVAADVDGLGDTAYGTGQSGIASAKAAVSCASGTTVNLDTITLAAGTWLVTYSVEWASNAKGRRAMTLTTNATSMSSTPVYMESGAPANGLATNFSRTQVIVATASTTRYLNAYQNSGSALNCRSCIQAVRIA